MSCASCAISVETILTSQKGVNSAVVNFANNSVLVDFDAEQISEQELKKSIQDVGYDLILNIETNSEASDQILSNVLKEIRSNTLWSGIFSVPLMIIGMFFMNMPFANYIMWLLATPVVFIWGRNFFIHAFHQLKLAKANMDTLVALSTGIAYLFSVFNTLNPDFWHKRGLHPHVYFEASAVIIFFILLGKLLEERAKSGTSAAIKKLIGLQPKTAHLLQHDQTSIELPIDQIKLNDELIIKPGEKIPVDGKVTQGESYVDESTINGEPIPNFKTKESKVFAGTINQKGSLIIKAESIGSDTLLAQIIKMVQEAQGSKAPIQKLTDKIAGVFVPIVIVLSLITFITWMIFGGENNITYGLLSSITVLVIACPCALGLATPTAVMVGIGKGAQMGVLIKDADALEKAKHIEAIILDKTGTITIGKPLVEKLIWQDELSDNNELKSILFSLESKSEHPLASAICESLKEQELIQLDSFESITGKGVKAKVNGKVYFVGSIKFMEESKLLLSDKFKYELKKYEKTLHTLIAFANEKEVLCIAAITDSIKPTALNAILQLKELNIEVHMLTGDSSSVAQVVAAQTGIQHFKASVLPAEKANYIKMLQNEGKVVAMVGDGINDSNALAQSDVGFAMSKGSDIAMDVAKITIMSNDLTLIAKAIKLSRLTVAKIDQNLFWAFIYNVIGIPLAAGVLFPVNGFILNPMIAGAAMALSSVSVVSNSLLLKFKKI
ncbi:MAG: heavy metal translocating P-type ATPase [Sphingobacteriaceae bacterium]